MQCSTQLQGSIEKCKREQRKLDERFINVVGKVEQYLALVSNKKMTEKEANFHDRIIKLREGLKKLSTKSLILKKKVNANYTDLEERINEESKLLTITKIDNIQEKEMFSLLSSQSKAIERLIKVVRKDMRDLNLIKSKKNSP